MSDVLIPVKVFDISSVEYSIYLFYIIFITIRPIFSTIKDKCPCSALGPGLGCPHLGF